MPPIWYFPNFLFDFPKQIYLREGAADSNSDRFYRSLLQDIVDAVVSKASVNEHILKRAESGKESDKRALTQLLLAMGRNITTEVFGAWSRIFRRNVEKRVALTIAESEERGWYIEFHVEDVDGDYYVHERSLGFRWFFVFLLLTTYRGFRKDSPRNLFDEPASNLHAGAQAELLSSLERLGDACTTIYTTHSQHLINPNWLENTHVVRNKGLEFGPDVTDYNAGKTDIVIERYRIFASKHPHQSHYFQPILDMLDYAPSQLELVPDMVMAEGKNDFYALKYMHEVILGLGIDLHFMPGAGAGSLDQVIQLYIGWARNFLVVLDSDDEGEKQKKRYIEKFGPIVNNRIITLADLDPDLVGKSMEHAFEIEDREAIQGVAYPAERYQKKKFSRALQEALAMGAKVPISKLTVARFGGLLSGLKARLDASK